MKKFNDHESSHTQARMKWEAQGQPQLPERFSTELRRSQDI